MHGTRLNARVKINRLNDGKQAHCWDSPVCGSMADLLEPGLFDTCTRDS